MLKIKNSGILVYGVMDLKPSSGSDLEQVALKGLNLHNYYYRILLLPPPNAALVSL